MASPSSAREVTLLPVASGLTSPVQVTHAGDGRLFVVEQRGVIKILRNGVVEPSPFLDIIDRVLSGGERGLLSVAFDPDFASNGRLFVDYTAKPDGATVISRFELSNDPDRVDVGSEAVLLRIPQPFSNHNGGQLQFGPDRMLYIGMGDGGSGNDPQCFAQRQDSLLGKLLRVDPSGSSAASPFYRVPPDNPFIGPGGYADEVWSLGLRNPFRFSFDRQTGELFLGDVGQNDREEIDLVAPGEAGLNFGWKVLEGNLCLGSTSGCPAFVGGCNSSGYRGPILEYDHSDGECSVTGGTVSRGSGVPEVFGEYLYGDFCSGRIWSARRQGNAWVPRSLGLTVPSLVGFGEDAAGEIYVVSLSGTIQRIASTNTPPPPGSAGTISFDGPTSVSLDESAADSPLGILDLEVSRTGGSVGSVSASVELRLGATPGQDLVLDTPTVSWAAGETGPRTVRVRVLDDALAERDETVEIALAGPTGGVQLGTPSVVLLTILDDERRAPCDQNSPDGAELCLLDGRFSVRSEWRTTQGTSGIGHGQSLTSDSGRFWFFEPNNIEVVVKTLDACAPFDHFWVFAAGLTDVEVRMSVVDTETDEIVVYQNSLGVPFQPITDTGAFASCP